MRLKPIAQMINSSELKMKMLMKNITSCVTKYCALAGLLSFGFGGLCRAAVGEIKAQAWQFNSGDSPVIPEYVTNSSSHGVAVVSPGPFGSGWVAQDNLFAGATGVWDLGRNGTIACSGLAGLVGSPGQERVFTVKVKQYNDGAVYADRATVFVPGAALQNTTVTAMNSGTIGGWVTEETLWKAPAATTVDQLSIVSAYYGSLVDQVSVETVLAALPPPTLAIRRVGNQVEVSWPSGFSGMVLESSSNLADAQSWSPVGAAVQTSGETSSVTLETQADAQFYRLKQP